MTKLERLAKIKEITDRLKLDIIYAEENQKDNLVELKKEFHTLKLEAITILEEKNEKVGLNYNELEELVKSLPYVPHYSTGIEPLDEALKGGIESGTFIQFGGESGMGKTTLVVEILTNIARKYKVVFFSFEMGLKRSYARLNKLVDDELQKSNLIIDFDSKNINNLINEITLYASDGIKFFAIDSKMKIETGLQEEYKSATLVSDKLAKLAQKLDIIIFLINQMNEEDIKNKRLAFKGSGNQKYDADMSLFYVQHEKVQTARRLICNKNRTGDEQLFSLELTYHKDKTISLTDKPKEIVIQYEMGAI